MFFKIGPLQGAQINSCRMVADGCKKTFLWVILQPLKTCFLYQSNTSLARISQKIALFFQGELDGLHTYKK